MESGQSLSTKMPIHQRRFSEMDEWMMESSSLFWKAGTWLSNVKYNSEWLNLISESLGAIDVTDVARQLRKQYMDLARHWAWCLKNVAGYRNTAPLWKVGDPNEKTKAGAKTGEMIYNRNPFIWRNFHVLWWFRTWIKPTNQPGSLAEELPDPDKSMIDLYVLLSALQCLCIF